VRSHADPVAAGEASVPNRDLTCQNLGSDSPVAITASIAGARRDDTEAFT